jgi:hypothetical protein
MTVKAKKNWYSIEGGRVYEVIMIRNGMYKLRYGKSKRETDYFDPSLFEVVDPLPRPPCNTIQLPPKYEPDEYDDWEKD